jgi:(4-alkanoyl-5-oxo-2,5-dihydrofuran-3-yl)methyl phosphate reductase
MILVTGATGVVGSEVLRQLAASGKKVRALVRNRASAAKLGPHVELVEGDFEKPETIAAALQGVDAMYLLVPASPSLPKQEAAAIDAAKRAGVKHIVKHSVMGAQYEPGIAMGRWHRAGEKLLEASGLKWTFIRPTGFMSNAFQWVQSIKGQGKVYQPMGEGKLAVVDPRDIAAVAVKALTEPGHEGKSYDVTGGEALSMAEQVKILGDAIGKPLTYVDVPDTAAKDGMLKMGMPEAVVDGLLEFTAMVRSGYAATMTDSVSKVTGKPPRKFGDWARENAAAFK